MSREEEIELISNTINVIKNKKDITKEDWITIGMLMNCMCVHIKHLEEEIMYELNKAA